MRPSELTNFTVWGKAWFRDEWEGLRELCEQHGLAGVELLSSGVTEATAPPSDLIGGVHLQSLGAWLKLAGLDVPEFGAGAPQYAEADSYAELVALRADEIRRMAQMQPSYAIWHASYAAYPQIFGGETILEDEAFLTVLARFFQDVVDSYLPPFPICFENCFGAGLQFDAPGLVSGFMDSLAGTPAALAFDTGHYLNLHREHRSETEACRALMRVADSLGAEGLRTEVIHLHWTPPELVPDGPSEYAYSMEEVVLAGEGFAEQVALAFARCDQHKPFTSPQIAAVIDALAPTHVVHEMGAMTLEDHTSWLASQTAAIRGG